MDTLWQQVCAAFPQANLVAAWVGIALGLIAGVVLGLFFHRENWLGGYGSWPRRLVRLGHISFFGIAFLNLAFVYTANSMGLDKHIALPGLLLIAGAIAMPTVCFLSAWALPLRHMFFIPVGCLLGGVLIFLFTGVLS